MFVSPPNNISVWFLMPEAGAVAGQLPGAVRQVQVGRRRGSVPVSVDLVILQQISADTSRNGAGRARAGAGCSFTWLLAGLASSGCR